MKIALLHNLRRGSEEFEAEFDEPSTIAALSAAIAQQHEVIPIECTRRVHEWLDRLASLAPDLVFNVAEGHRGAARESLYPALCEEVGLRYCGPGPTELLVCHNKALTKTLLRGSAAPMAWDALIGSREDLDRLGGVALPFPLFVKLNSEGSSMGVGPESIVPDRAALAARVALLLEHYQTNVLVEEYRPGRDMSLSFIEGLGVFGPVEYTYPSGSAYDFFWKTARNDLVDVTTPHDLSAATQGALVAATNDVVARLDLAGYARLDFRVSADGAICFLEANAQVSFHPKGAFVLAPADSGHSYEDVILHIVRWASEQPRRVCRVGRQLLV